MKNYEELLSLADKLQARAEMINDPSFAIPVNNLEKAVVEVSRSASGSCLGYHANVYYADFKRPPTDDYFSMEWGFFSPYDDDDSINWKEYDQDTVKEYIHKIANNPDLSEARDIEKKAVSLFEKTKSDALSIIDRTYA